MFGFGKKEAPSAARLATAAHEIFIRQEGAFIALKRLVEMGLVSREDATKVWGQADRECRRIWRAKKPDVVFLGPLSIESIWDADEDDV